MERRFRTATLSRIHVVYNLVQKGRYWVLVVLLGNVIINESFPIFLDSAIGGGIAAVVISTAAIGHYRYPYASYVLLTSLSVIFGIIPQVICVRHGLAIGAKCAPFVLCLMYIFSPIAYPIAKLLDHVLGKSETYTYKKAELTSSLQFHRAGEEPLRNDEISILNGELELNNRKVENSNGYSQIRIHEPGDPLAFQGLLLVKKAKCLSFLDQTVPDTAIQLLIYDPSKCLPVSHFKLSTLPEAHPSINCFQALDYFQTGRAHLLLISRTQSIAGGAIGVITLEDAIEEIISEEIVDETDRNEDNQSKKQARRLTNAAAMRSIVERERNLTRQTPVEQCTPLLPISPQAGTPPRGGYGTPSASYKH
ncbi:hypothetical protein EDD17DRAFT_1894561 [Pisolithus thermaeus]|nr:hypothetical protein EDD17DRAFT_1894561 [Pisolithus thermaeus]